MSTNKTILLNLLWKEWREHCGRMIACCAIVGVWCAMEFGRDARAVEISFISVLIVSVVVLPIFICMAIGAEWASGSLAMLLSRPVPPWRVLAVKTVVGCATCLAPVLTIGLMAWLLMGPKVAQKLAIGQSTLLAGLAAVTVYIWMLALSSRRPNEAAVGLTCLLFLVVCAVLSVLLDELHMEMAFTYGARDRLWETYPLWTAVLIGTITALHWVWAAWLFGGPPTSKDRAASPATRGRVAERPLQSFSFIPIAALLWKEWRINRIWCIGMLGVFAGLFMFAEGDVRVWLSWFALMVVVLAVLVPVTGLGRELDPSLHDLLRARPISPGQWFFTKYGFGLGVVLIPLVLSPLLVLGILIYWAVVHHRTPEQLGWQLLIPLLFLYVGVILAYSVSTLITCTVRQPIYSGILSTGLVMMIYLLPATYDLDRWGYALFCYLADRDPQRDIPADFVHMFWLVMTAMAVLASGGSTWLAWRIVRWQWWTEPFEGIDRNVQHSISAN